jgi:hypothetical protein
LAIAAVLLISLGFGFFAFGPFRADSDRPEKMPAAVAPAASPTATPYPRTDHPIIGAWLWDYDTCRPGTNTTFVVFDADGTYIEYQNFPGVTIGRWWATGERTVELYAITQKPAQLDKFEPGGSLPKDLIVGDQVSEWQAIEVDETGNALTARGYYEPRDASGDVIVHLEFGDECNYEMVATRLSTVSIATPTP